MTILSTIPITTTVSQHHPHHKLTTKSITPITTTPITNTCKKETNTTLPSPKSHHCSIRLKRRPHHNEIPCKLIKSLSGPHDASASHTDTHEKKYTYGCKSYTSQAHTHCCPHHYTLIIGGRKGGGRGGKSVWDGWKGD